MRIHFNGAKNIRRLVGKYAWNRENGHTTSVDDAHLCADLLTARDGDFSVAQDEPLLQTGMDANHLAALAMFGICDIAGLAALNRKGITVLARETGQNVKQIRAWVHQAKLLMINGGTQ